jgi:hypothetical protein
MGPTASVLFASGDCTEAQSPGLVAQATLKTPEEDSNLHRPAAAVTALSDWFAPGERVSVEQTPSLFLCRLSRVSESFVSRGAFRTRLPHLLTASILDPFLLGVNVGVQSGFLFSHNQVANIKYSVATQLRKLLVPACYNQNSICT